MTGGPSADGSGEGEPWYRRWFGDRYLEIYPHRDRAEARRAVELFLARAAPPRGPVLDLGCGAGRHLEAFRDRGREAVGLDLSAPLLAAARRAGAARLVRGDMRRLPFADGAFGSVTSFFTSFGYFRDPADDVRVVAEAGRVLRPGGVFLLDYLNAPKVRRDLVPEDEREVEGRRVRQRRWIEDGAVKKRIEIDPGGEGPESVFHERVRLYAPRELEEMVAARGFRVEDRFGGYDGTPYRADSPRAILVARLEEPASPPGPPEGTGGP